MLFKFNSQKPCVNIHYIHFRLFRLFWLPCGGQQPSAVTLWFRTVTNLETHQHRKTNPSQTSTQKNKNNFHHLHERTQTRPERHRINRSMGWWGARHSNSRSSSVSSVSMLAGSAMGPNAARRAAISSSVLSLSCFFFSWIFFSLEEEEMYGKEDQRKTKKSIVSICNGERNIGILPVEFLSFSLIQLCDDVGEGAINPGDNHWKMHKRPDELQ